MVPEQHRLLTGAYEIGGESTGTDTCPDDPCSTYISGSIFPHSHSKSALQNRKRPSWTQISRETSFRLFPLWMPWSRSPLDSRDQFLILEAHGERQPRSHNRQEPTQATIAWLEPWTEQLWWIHSRCHILTGAALHKTGAV